MASPEKTIPETAPEKEKLPAMRAKKKKGQKIGSLRPLYVLILRVTAGMSQAEAADVVWVSERTWRKWEGEEGSKNNHRYPQEAFIELFCKKRALTYPPKVDLKPPDLVDKGGQ